MKRFALILFLLAYGCAAKAADLVISNFMIGCVFGDSYMISDASAGMVTGHRFVPYLESYWRMKYPTKDIHLFNLSRSGGTMDDVDTNRVQQNGLAIWAYTNNTAQHLGISQPTDNGSLNSNQMFLAQSNIFLAPALMSDGTSAHVTHTGWTASHGIQWIALGDPPGAASDGGATSVKYRNDGSTNGGVVFGIRGADSFNTLSNAWVSDYNTNSGNNIQLVYPGGVPHFMSGGALSWVDSFVSQIDTDTNISTCTLSWSGSVVDTNNCYISGLTVSGYTMTFNRQDDRLPGAWDVPDGVITNDARPAFILNPTMPDRNLFTVKITGLPIGNYSVVIDGTTVAASSSSYELSHGNGWNMYTNYTGPYWAQRKEVLGRIRDKDHVDRVTLANFSADGHGLFSYVSAATVPWGNGLRGDDLINSTLTNNVADLMSLDALTKAAAQPTNHTFTITQIITADTPTLKTGTVHWGQ